MRKCLSGLALALGLACNSQLPHPPYANQPTSALTEVDFPPPPARVEIVPDAPSDSAVWIDGEWQWEGSKWGWKAGAWLTPPPGSRYARPILVRRQDGKLFFAAGTWRNAEGREVSIEGRAKVEAKSRSSVIVNPEGENEPTAPDVTVDGGK